jgi:hypothetical protein
VAGIDLNGLAGIEDNPNEAELPLGDDGLSGASEDEGGGQDACDDKERGASMVSHKDLLRCCARRLSPWLERRATELTPVSVKADAFQ